MIFGGDPSDILVRSFQYLQRSFEDLPDIFRRTNFNRLSTKVLVLRRRKNTNKLPAQKIVGDRLKKSPVIVDFIYVGGRRKAFLINKPAVALSTRARKASTPLRSAKGLFPPPD